VARRGRNYRITGDEGIGTGGPKARAKANIAAIRTLKTIESEGRPATEEEQAILVRYVGWGDSRLASIFQTFKSAYAPRSRAEEDFGDLATELKEILTPEEYKQAEATVNNAHYTSLEVIGGIYEALDRMGVQGGRFLEPGAGIGHFIGMRPDVKWTATEIDALTGRIAAALYPEANVRVQGFQDLHVPDNTFDVAISNVPFHKQGPEDKRYPQSYSLHDYFFIKSLDKVRPGGIVAFVTSSFSMDKRSSRARMEMEKRADIVGAIRLPNTAFQKNAGTQVTTDIIFLRKRAPGERPSGVGFRKAVPVRIDDAGNIEVVDFDYDAKPKKGQQWERADFFLNEYYVANPHMIVGTLSSEGSMYGGKTEMTVTFDKDADLSAALAERVARLPEGIYTERVAKDQNPEAEPDLAPPHMKEGAMVVSEGGRVMHRQNGVLVPADIPPAEAPKVKALIGIRDALATQRALELSDATDQEIEANRKDLAKLYDGFVKKHGPINAEVRTVRQLSPDPETGEERISVTVKRPNLDAFDGDPESPAVAALEFYSWDANEGVEDLRKHKIARKADILERRILRRHVEVTKADSADDALTHSLNNRGRVDPEYMARLLGQDVDTVTKQLFEAGAIYDDPDSGTWHAANLYLSGDVKTKLERAQDNLRHNPRYQKHVDALREVIETELPDVPPSKIYIPLGAPWVPLDMYQRFVRETMRSYSFKIAFHAKSGEWSVATERDARGNATATSEYGSTDQDGNTRRNGWDILEATLNGKVMEVKDRDGEKDVDATLKAQEKQQKFKDAFEKWLKANEEVLAEAAAIYNRQFNNTVEPKFNGDYLTMPGAASHIGGKKFSLRKHQKDAISRIIQTGSTLLGHVVGAGKTFTMIGAGMEMKRLGIVQKPMYVVPNHMLEQFSREFKQLYPNANILVATKEDFAADRRKLFTARVANNDWDAVIMTHSSFGNVPMSQAAVKEWFDKEIAALKAEIVEQKANKGGKGKDDQIIKLIQDAVKRLEARLAKAMMKEQDDTVDFEGTGVDFLFVDELHYFKNLYARTKLPNVGISESQRATDMFLKTSYLNRLNPGRALVGATGTPISNSMVELYTMMRYHAPDAMAQSGMDVFDNWANTFGEVVTATELAPGTNKYRQKTRFSKFKNVPELIQRFRSFTDIVLAEDLGIKLEDGRNAVPPVKGGKSQIHAAQPGLGLKAFVKWLVVRSDNMKNVDPTEDNFLNLTTDGRVAAMDLRLFSRFAKGHDQSKTDIASEQVARIYRETSHLKGVQLVFSDIGTPKKKTAPKKATKAKGSIADLAGIDDSVATDKEARGLPGFSTYREMKEKLVTAGVPAAEIAFIHDADNDAKKARLFQQVREGKIRVLIGSTDKMGAGTNVQDRAVAIHHLDAPWRPADVEQRDGRVIRQGNKLWEGGLIDGVEVHRYVTEGSFDAFMWQTLERKMGFIQQILRGDRTTREMEDADDVQADAATTKAIATGNPLLQEKATLDIQVAKLQREKQNHADERYAHNRNIKHQNYLLDLARSRLKSAEKDLARRVDPVGTGFRLVIGKQEYTKREQAGDALFDKVLEVVAKRADEMEFEVPLGKFAGFPLILRREQDWDHKQAKKPGAIYLGVEGESLYDSSHFVAAWEAGKHALQTLDHIRTLVAGIERTIENSRDSIASAQDNIARLEALLQEKWGKDAQLEDALARQAELAAVLDEAGDAELRYVSEYPPNSAEWWAAINRGEDPWVVMRGDQVVGGGPTLIERAKAGRNIGGKADPEALQAKADELADTPRTDEDAAALLESLSPGDRLVRDDGQVATFDREFDEGRLVVEDPGSDDPPSILDMRRGDGDGYTWSDDALYWAKDSKVERFKDPAQPSMFEGQRMGGMPEAQKRHIQRKLEAVGVKTKGLSDEELIVAALDNGILDAETSERLRRVLNDQSGFLRMTAGGKVSTTSTPAPGDPRVLVERYPPQAGFFRSVVMPTQWVWRQMERSKDATERAIGAKVKRLVQAGEEAHRVFGRRIDHAASVLHDATKDLGKKEKEVLLVLLDAYEARADLPATTPKKVADAFDTLRGYFRETWAELGQNNRTMLSEKSREILDAALKLFPETKTQGFWERGQDGRWVLSRAGRDAFENTPVNRAEIQAAAKRDGFQGQWPTTRDGWENLVDELKANKRRVARPVFMDSPDLQYIFGMIRGEGGIMAYMPHVMGGEWLVRHGAETKRFIDRGDAVDYAQELIDNGIAMDDVLVEREGFTGDGSLYTTRKQYEALVGALTKQLAAEQKDVRDALHEKGRIKARPRRRWHAHSQRRAVNLQTFEKDLETAVMVYAFRHAKKTSFDPFRKTGLEVAESLPVDGGWRGWAERYMSDAQGVPQDWVESINRTLQGLSGGRMKPFQVQRWVSAWQGVMGLFHLGLSPSTALVNLTQIPINVVPAMPEQGNLYVRRAWRKMWQNDAETQRVLDEAGVSYQHAKHQGGEYVPTAWQNRGALNTVAMWMFNQTEVINRGTAVLAMYHYRRDRGASHKAALQAAIEFSNKTNFVYGIEGSGSIQRNPVGRALMQFKTYSLNQVFFSWDTLKFGSAKQRTAFITSMISFGGLHVLAAATPLAAINWLGGKTGLFDDEDEEGNKVRRTPYQALMDAARKIGMDPLTDLFQYGILSLFGLTLGERVGSFGSLRDFNSLPGGKVADLYAAIQEPDPVRRAAAWRRLRPTQVARIERMVEAAQTGEIRDTRGNLVDQEVGVVDLGGLGIGIQTIEQAKRSERENRRRSSVDSYNKRRTRYRGQAVEAHRRGDREEVSRIIQEAKADGVTLNATQIGTLARQRDQDDTSRRIRLTPTDLRPRLFDEDELSEYGPRTRRGPQPPRPPTPRAPSAP